VRRLPRTSRRRPRLLRAFVEDPGGAIRADRRIEPLLDDVSNRFVFRFEDVRAAEFLAHAAALPSGEHRRARPVEVQIAAAGAPGAELFAPEPVARLVD